MEFNLSIPLNRKFDAEQMLFAFRKDLPKDKRDQFAFSWENEVVPIEIGKFLVPTYSLQLNLNDPDFGSWRILSAKSFEKRIGCDHCKMFPKAHSSLFVIGNGDSSFLLGRECIRSLASSISESWIDVYASIFKFERQLSQVFNPEKQMDCLLVSKEEFIAACVSHFSNFPFMSSKSETPSWKAIRTILLSEEWNFDSSDSVKAEPILSFWKEKSIQSSLEIEIQNMLESNFVLSSNFSKLAYGVSFALDQLSKKNSLIGFNRFFGTVDQEEETKLKMVSSKEIQTKFGKSFLIFLETEAGHSIKMFSQKGIIPFEGFKPFSFNVKRHETFRDKNSTLVDRLKRLPEQ